MRRLAAVLIVAALALPAASGNRQAFGHALTSYQVLAPSADASTSNWVANGAASHFDCINDAPDSAGLFVPPSGAVHDGDTTYISCAGTTLCTDVFDLTNGSGLSGKTIVFVTATYVSKKPSGTGAPPTTAYLVVSATDYSTGTLSTSSTTYIEVSAGTRYYTNPNTGVAWTSADIDALQLKVQRTATGSASAYVTAMQVVVAYEDPIPNSGTNRQRSGGGN